MKACAALVLAICLSACAATVPTSGLPERSVVAVDGQLYDIGQLTDSTWTAIAKPGIGPAVTGSAHRTAVLRVIERLSKCQVTDSDYSLEGRQLDAQVNCESRLKN